MCGILAVFGFPGVYDALEFHEFVRKLSKKQQHRGPDWSGVIVDDSNSNKGVALAHERLAIVGTSTGAQPLHSTSSSAILTVNGEIYNYKSLKAEAKDYNFSTQSDCEVILALFEKEGESFISKLDGIFAFVIYDGKGNYLVARDAIGVIPLYQGWGRDGSVWFASELKCLIDVCERITVFQPGFYYSSKTNCLKRFYEPIWFDEHYLPIRKVDLIHLRQIFENAVIKQMMSEVPFGLLLSGGLDSSLVASIAQRYRKQNSLEPLSSFSIGLIGAPDHAAAKKVAQFIGTKHYELHYTLQEGLDSINDIIWHLETYDVTTIRASIPMYLLARHIKALGIKMVLSGEGSDEIFAGYLYFHSAPNASQLHKETVARVRGLHRSDCLRANKSTMAWGIEVRPPFLDLDFVNYSMTIDPIDKMITNERIEKHILRQAFEDSNEPYLPSEILWRQKEQFSDGVGYAWIDTLKQFASKRVSLERLNYAADVFPIDTPTTQEAYYYREIFDKMFPTASARATVQRWIPRVDWGCSTDPSGRAQKSHISTTESKQ
eukprot:TRINITY_DN763_c0_g6_i1.p1 TRINITY_DN763_c0_g6~~TRINITY_DN763_c0_g6_i1.p1  ORF type:complete len:547 (-),score=288.65 TRINITY_DN763_c0_g6_i1:85-1725(-)